MDLASRRRQALHRGSASSGGPSLRRGERRRLRRSGGRGRRRHRRQSPAGKGRSAARARRSAHEEFASANRTRDPPTGSSTGVGLERGEIARADVAAVLRGARRSATRSARASTWSPARRRWPRPSPRSEDRGWGRYAGGAPRPVRRRSRPGGRRRARRRRPGRRGRRRRSPRAAGSRRRGRCVCRRGRSPRSGGRAAARRSAPARSP